MNIGNINIDNTTYIRDSIKQDKTGNYSETVAGIFEKVENDVNTTSSGADLLRKITNTKGKEFVNEMQKVTESYSSTKSNAKLSQQAQKLVENLAEIALDGEGSLFIQGMPKDVDQISKFKVSAVKDVGDFTLEVKQLACSQINSTANLNPKEQTMMASGKHFFTMNLDGKDYEMVIKVEKNDTNEAVYEKIMTAINSSGVKANAQLEYNEDKTQCNLLITPERTGKPQEGQEMVFSFASKEGSNLTELLCLNQIKQEGKNAIFSYNGGEDIQHPYNSVFVDKSVYIDFLEVTEGAVEFHFDYDMDTLADKMLTMVNNYNELVSLAKETGNNVLNKMVDNMTELLKSNMKDLMDMGFSFDYDKKLALNDGRFYKTDIKKLEAKWNGKDKLAYQLGDLAANFANYVNRLNGTSRKYYGLKAKKSNAALRQILNKYKFTL